MTVLEFYFSILFFNTWKICPQISISLWVKRSYKNLVIGADKVVRLVTGENGIVFMDDFFGVPPSVLIISSVDPNLSSYYTAIGCEGGRSSKKS